MNHHKKNIYSILKWMMITFIPLVLCFCSGKRDRTVIPGIYYWKTTYKLTHQEKDWLKGNGIKKLYLRMFDVDWNESLNTPVPAGDVDILSAETAGLEIIPVVFITNKTFLKISSAGTDSLAVKIQKKIDSKLSRLNCVGIREIQFDCDWSERSRNNYFDFLQSIKKLYSGKIISATIRLHQVKYFRRTGVPRVDRGMLMFYNMGSVDDYKVKNSIFDAETAEKYLVNFDKYPLPLDAVLPAFSWGALFRNGKLIELINEPDTLQMKKTGCFSEPAPGQFLCLSSMKLQGINIFKHDIIKLESAGLETTLLAAKIISKHIKTDKLTVALYHLSNKVVGTYEKTAFESITASFH